MRILLLHNNYTVQGGAEVFFHEIGRLLEQRGHDVARFSCAEDGLDARFAQYFPEVTHYAQGGLLEKVARVPSIIYNRDAKAGMAKVLNEFRPDVVHGFATYGRLTPAVLVAAKEFRAPVVLSCNDYKHICPNYKLYHHGRLCEDCRGGKFFRATLNRCCHDDLATSIVSSLEAYSHGAIDIWRKNVDVFLFASRFMARKTVEFWGEGRVTIDMLQNPFDADAHYVEPKVGNTILYFGRLIDEKGVDVLLHAARLCPDIPVVIVGDGPQRHMVEESARELANVEFAGAAWGDDLKKHLREARAVVVPSLWHENFPYVVLQAFAASKPVIGSRRGGIPELIDAGPHGWTFEPTMADELAERMRRAASMSQEEVLQMGAKAQQYVASTFSDDVIYSELSRIYSEVLR